MSRYVRLATTSALFCGALAVLGLLAGPSPAQVKVFRGPNANPNFILPPGQNSPILNNGSLYTWGPNPTFGFPGQLQFAFTAVAHQDCRLYHNGATLMPFPRLVAGL